MRITNSNMINSYLRDVQNNLQSTDKLNTQLNTGKQVNKVSDDPFRAIKIMNTQNEINDVEKYNYNCDEITGWLDATDAALDKVGNLTSDIKVLLTSISGTFGKDEIKAISAEVNEKMKQIGEAMNTTYAGKYIFGGSATDEEPTKIKTDPDTGEVTLTSTTNPKADEKLKVEISDGITLDYNLSINQITKTAGKESGATSGLDVLNKISKALSNDPVDMDEIGRLSTDLDGYMTDILNNRAVVGAKTNTVESIKSSNEENILEMTATFSLIQDVDFAEKHMELKEAEMAYMASLQVGTKLLKTTILDYI